MYAEGPGPRDKLNDYSRNLNGFGQYELHLTG